MELMPMYRSPFNLPDNLFRSEIQHCAGDAEIVGDDVDTVGIIGSADRVNALNFCYLIMEKLKDGFLARVHVIYRERLEDG